MARGACHCLCSHNHAKQRGICKATHDETVSFKHQVGVIPVPMCTPCAAATRESRKDDLAEAR